MSPTGEYPTSSDSARSSAWDERALRDPHGEPAKAARVEAMFNAIAPTYERVNTVASLGRDARWRRCAVLAADVRAGDVVLDVCCGTGDMLRALAAGHPAPARLIGVDFAREMLNQGTYAGVKIPLELLHADALALPIADGAVDVVTCAFGVRNFQDLPAGLREMWRVLRPGGRVVILEFAPPANRLLRWGYRKYCDVALPLLGRLISRDRSGAYQYLPRSIETFETRAEMTRRLADAGFTNVTSVALNFGGVVVYRGERSQAG